MLRKKPFRHSPVLFFRGKWRTRLSYVESCNLSMSSRATCPCRVVQLVHAESCNLSMPSRATCPCRVVQLVHAESYDLFMPGRTDIKKKTAHPAVSKIRSPFFVMRSSVRVLPHHFRHHPSRHFFHMSPEDAFTFYSKILLNHMSCFYG